MITFLPFFIVRWFKRAWYVIHFDKISERKIGEASEILLLMSQFPLVDISYLPLEVWFFVCLESTNEFLVTSYWIYGIEIHSKQSRAKYHKFKFLHQWQQFSLPRRLCLTIPPCASLCFLLQTLCALIRGVHQKNKSTSGFDIINMLMGFDKAELCMKVRACYIEITGSS